MTRRNLTVAAKRLGTISAVGVVAVVGLATPAGAVRAERNNGVGVCVSQLALASETFLDVPHLGTFVRDVAHEANVGDVLAGARNTCGEPPGPGHLGG